MRQSSIWKVFAKLDHSLSKYLIEIGEVTDQTYFGILQERASANPLESGLINSYYETGSLQSQWPAGCILIDLAAESNLFCPATCSQCQQTSH